jgi:hypothetical protein
MNDDTEANKWWEAQDSILLEEFRHATGKAAKSMEEAGKWFMGLSLAERDRVSRRVNDLDIIGRHLQTPRTH